MKERKNTKSHMMHVRECLFCLLKISVNLAVKNLFLDLKIMRSIDIEEIPDNDHRGSSSLVYH